jgi:CO/xanthine dehydrogenase FAD-binding subunit
MYGVREGHQGSFEKWILSSGYTLYDVDVQTPSSLDEALRLLGKEKYRILAGGTDVLVQLRDGILRDKKLLNISQLDELNYIKADGDEVRIGALTSFTNIAESKEVRRYAPMLAEASGKVGSVQITNKGTIGGNLGNASPSGDSLPPLYALDARLVLASAGGRREVAVKDFVKGYKQLDLGQNELIAEVRFRKMKSGEDGRFLKHSLRFGEAISVVSVCIWLRWGVKSREVADARIALGAVAPTIVRAQKAEAILKGGVLDERRAEAASRAVSESISPITDVRGSLEYRRDMAVNLTRIALDELAKGGQRK